VPPGAAVYDRPVTQRGAVAEPATTAVVRAPAVLPRAGAPARPGTGRRRRAPGPQVAASPDPVVQGSTVETQQRPDTERNRDCPACPRSARFASWTNRQCINVGVRRSSARCATHGQSWRGSRLAVPGCDYPDRQADWVTNRQPLRWAAGALLGVRGPWWLVGSSSRAGMCCAPGAVRSGAERVGRAVTVGAGRVPRWLWRRVRCRSRCWPGR